MRLMSVVLAIAAVTACSRHSFDGFLSSGDRYLAAKKFGDAAIEFQNAARINPQSAAAQIKLGDAYTALNQTAAAAAAYHRACTLDPQNAAGCVQAAATFLSRGEFEATVATARAALSVDRFNLDAQLLLGSALAGVRRFAEAEERLQAALAMAPTDPRPYKAIGDLNWRRGDVKAAEGWLRQAVDRDPSSSASRVELARVLLDSGHEVDGERELRAVIAANPDDVAATELLATHLMETDRCDDAEPYWKAVAAKSADGSGALALADFYISRGRSDEALKALSANTAPAQEAAVKSRMASIIYDGGDRGKALAMVDQVLERHQSNVGALLLKARMSLDDGDVAKAREYAHRAAEVQPDTPAVRNMLAATSAADSKR